MDKYERETLYIPMGLKVHNEIFEGFGKSELLKSIIATLVLGAMVGLYYLISQNVSFSVIFILASIAGSIMLFTKDKTNLSAADQITNMFNYLDLQKSYDYKYLDEWRIICEDGD